MLALRPWIAIVTILLVPTLSAYLVLRSDGKPEYLALVGILTVIGLVLLRRSVVEPLRALRSWRKLADELGWKFFGDLSHEPFITGDVDGTPVVAGVAAHLVQAGHSQQRYRTLISAPVAVGIPAGLRVYGRDLDAWANDYSERRRVPTGDEVLEDRLRCEGIDAEAVRVYVSHDRRRALLLDFLQKWPGMLVHGGDGAQLPAVQGGASGLVTVAIVGRTTDRDLLRQCIDDVHTLATELGR